MIEFDDIHAAVARYVIERDKLAAIEKERRHIHEQLRDVNERRNRQQDVFAAASHALATNQLGELAPNEVLVVGDCVIRCDGSRLESYEMVSRLDIERRRKL